MATVYPFCACLPKPELASQVASLPYDVYTRAEARATAEGNPLSFLRVTLSDIELPDEVSSYDATVYERAAANWQKLLGTAVQPDAAPSYYVYSLVMDGRCQTGIVGCVSVDEYNAGIVRKHERTRQEKEDDRTRHILTTKAQTGPVFLAYRDVAALDHIVERTRAEETPIFDFTAADGIRHTGWRINAKDAEEVRKAFEAVPILYIADGHHRATAAARSCEQLHGAGESGRTLAVIFPSSQLKILAYNRVVKDLNGLTKEQFLAEVAKVGEVTENAPAVPQAAGEVSFFLDGKWYGLRFRERHQENPIEALDVSLLQNQVLQPVLGIENPRTDKRIDFVGGIRGTAELERRVNAGEAVAFSMYPTSLEQLMDVADANGIMPPKSTWFEPKLRDGLFTHQI
ncbi:MAG: DUF1015 domain-containing protein [Victivallales bacterium]|nr:DUF1015 domain-containing protein [Victivallales bacterium]